MAISYEKSNVNEVPMRPLTSRFVAPWDTSGWYYISPNMAIGSKLYSNSEDTIAAIDEKYIGADYVVTFNSTADGFDDKQEVDFFAERDITVYVCLDTCNIPEYVSEWNKTGDTMTSSAGVTYAIYSKEYTTGEHVCVPGLQGEGNHFSVFVLPKDETGSNEAFPKTVISDKVLDAYVNRTYKNYITDVFNGEKICDCYTVEGNVALVEREEEKRDKYVSFNAASSIKRAFDGTDRVVASAKIAVEAGATAAFTLLGADNTVLASVAFEGGKASMAGQQASIVCEDGADMAVRLVYNGEAGEAVLFMECRKALCVPCAKGEAKAIAFTVTNGAAALDNLVVSDDAEIFVVNDDFESEASRNIAVTENAELTTVAYPFKDSVAYQIASKDEESASFGYAFQPVSGVVSVESLLVANSEDFSLAPELTDKNGTPAVRIAHYANNLYASNGQEFVRIFGGLCDFHYFPCKNAINVKVTVDTVNGTYDLMVDGAYRAKGFKLMNPVSDIANAVYTAGKNGLKLMRIRVYDAADFTRNMIPNAPVFDVTKAPYCAAGDGVTLDMEKIQQAINDAAFTGGTVYLPKGTYLSGELFLANDMTLWVDKDATILGTHDHSKYPLQEPGDSLCAVRQLGRGLVYGYQVSNVRVTGGGMLDGNGTYRFKMNDPYPDKRVEDCRPDLCYITYSKDIVIENINFKSPGFWTVVPLSSKNILMRYLNLDCLNTPNRDGIDPVDCHDMTIYSCNIMAGDDGLCFKSSDPYGCENIDVWDIMIQSLASGIKFGTDTYYSLKNTHVRDCYVKNVNRCGISLESVDGADIENVVFERISMTDVGAPVYITVGDRKRCPRHGHPVRLGHMDGVLFNELRFELAYPFSHTKHVREVMAIGQYDHARIENVTFRNCYFVLPGGSEVIPEEPKTIDNRYPEYDRHGASVGHAFTVKYAKNFRVEDCEIVLEKPDVRPMIAYFDYEE